MTDKTNKPVIFLAFANDHNGTVGQPLNLPDEERRIRQTLEAAQGLCEFVPRSNCTADDIFKVLQDARYRDRIAIFHFSGHANSFQLLLESRDGMTAAADARGLASFLAAQHGLRLVFLNGCSTRQQAQGLLDANKYLAAVIATSRAINDDVAINFSERFYAALAQGTTFRTAFDQACAGITTTRGSDHRRLYFGDNHGLPDDNRNSDGAPWLLYERTGSEVVDQWSLPHAVNDPLFGSPPLDETNLPDSPYKHLNWFTNDDAEIFFGRGRQIREMYDALTSGSQPVILFYGQSGVGKSSLLDAGLLPRLKKSCEVRYARRGDKGLLATLKHALGLAADDATSIETAWRTSETQLGKPLSVILDQVEECYTRPIQNLADELVQLLRAVEATFGEPAQRPRGKLVLSFREEWLARLEDEVKTFRLPRTKIFLKPLDRDGIIEVVQGPTHSRRLRERYALTIDDGLAGEIADDLLADRGSAIATTLQILLSKLWDKATEIPSETPKFTRDLYLDLKDKGILLRDFLDQQLQAFEDHMPEPATSGLLLDVLARHTTDLGTASQSSRGQIEQEYSHVSDRLPGLLQHCKDLYLLTTPKAERNNTCDTTRLAHDTLAPLVRAEFDKSDKPGQRARRILDNRSVDWADGKTGTPLDDADLKIIEEGQTGTRDWKPDEERLIKASRQAKEARERAVLDQMQREEKLRKEVLDTAQIARINAEKSEKKIRGWFRLAAALLVVATTLGAFGWWNYRAAETAKGKLATTNDDLRTTYSKLNDANKVLVESNFKLDEQIFANDYAQGLEYLNSSRYEDALPWLAHVLKNWGPRIDDATAYRMQICNHILGCLPTIRLLLFQDEPIHWAEFSADGTYIVTCGDKKAIVWDRATGERKHTLPHDERAMFATFTSDRDKLVVVCEKSLHVWSLSPDASEPNATKSLDLGTGSPNRANWDAKRERLFVTMQGSHPRAIVWDWRDGEKRELVYDTASTAALFTRDGKFLAVAVGNEVLLWDWRSSEVPRRLSHTAIVEQLAASPDGQFIASAANDGTVRQWNLKTNKERTTFPLRIAGGVSLMHYSTDGSTINLTAGGLISYYDAATWSLRPLPRVAPALRTTLDIRQLSPNQEEIVLASGQPWAYVFDAPSSVPDFASIKATGPVERTVFSPDGSRFAVVEQSGNIQIAETVSGKILAWIPKGAFYDVAFDNDPNHFWMTQGNRLVEVTAENGVFSNKIREVCTRNGHIRDLELSPDGSVMAVASEGTVGIINPRTGVLLRDLPHPAEQVLQIEFDATGKWLLTIGAEISGGRRIGRIWNCADGALICELGHVFNEQAHFCDNGKSVIVTSDDGKLRAWNVETGEVTMNRAGLAPGALAAAEAKDRFIVTETGGITLVGQSYQTDGKPIGIPLSHPLNVQSVAMSKDGSMCATGGLDGVAHAWDTNSGHTICHPLPHFGPVTGVRFSPDAKWLLTVTAGEDGGRDYWVRAWRIGVEPGWTDDDLIQMARLRSFRTIKSGTPVPLTVQELHGTWDTLRQRHPEAFRPTARQRVFYHHVQAAEAYRLGEWDLMATHLEQLLTLPDAPTTGPARANYLYWRARGLVASKQYAPAEENLQSAIAIVDDDPRYWSELASLYYNQKRWDRAAETYSKVVELLPKKRNPEEVFDFGVLLGQGWSLANLDRLSEAEEAFARALTIAPDERRFLVHRYLALCRLLQGKTDAYQQQRAELLQSSYHVLDGTAARDVALICVLAPYDDRQLNWPKDKMATSPKTLSQAMQKLIQRVADDQGESNIRYLRGLGNLRAGSSQYAIEPLRSTLNQNLFWSKGREGMALAICLSLRAEPELAQEEFANAANWIADNAGQLTEVNWDNLAEARVLKSEAEQTLRASHMDERRMRDVEFVQNQIKELIVKTTAAPTDYASWYELGLARMELGSMRLELAQWEQAADDLDKVIKADANRAAAWYYRGLALVLANRQDDYRQLCKEAADRFRTQPAASVIVLNLLSLGPSGVTKVVDYINSCNGRGLSGQEASIAMSVRYVQETSQTNSQLFDMIDRLIVNYETDRKTIGASPNPRVLLYGAILDRHLDRPIEAEQKLREARRETTLGRAAGSWTWNRELELELLLQETAAGDE